MALAVVGVLLEVGGLDVGFRGTESKDQVVPLIHCIKCFRESPLETATSSLC